MTLKILHTSDWHLGQSLHGRERSEEHQMFLDWLMNHLGEAAMSGEPYDALVVAGDIFDTSNPSGEARAQYHRFLAKLFQSKSCQNVVVIAGNHDSPLSLDATREILAELNVKVVGQVVSPGEDLHIIQGTDNQPVAIVCCAPFLRGEAITLQQDVSLAQCIRESTAGYFHEALQAARHKREELGCPHLPILATGHLWASGAKVGGSEREGQVGQLDHFGAEAFEGFDYVALGHIHSAQQVGRSNHIRYSGSPIPLSFAEAQQRHHVLAVRIGSDVEVEEIEVPNQRALLRFEGDPDQALEFLAMQGRRSGGEAELVPWAELKITLPVADSSVAGRLREAAKAARVEILKQHMETPEIRARLDLMREQVEAAGRLTPLSVFKTLLTEEDPELLETFNELLLGLPAETRP